MYVIIKLFDFLNQDIEINKDFCKRYLNNYYILWYEDIEKLRDFQIILNVIDVNIQFPMEYNRQQIPFLDILIKN